MIRGHVEKRGQEDIRPSSRMLRLWWGWLNKEVFEGALLPPWLSCGPSEQKYGEVDGLCYALEGGKVRIHLDSRCRTRESCLSTLAHEMVHQYQHQHGAAMTHGPSFQRWAAPIYCLTGLTI